MIIKYEVKTKTRTTYFDDRQQAINRARGLEQVGIFVEVYKITTQLYVGDRELVYKAKESK